MMRSLIVIALLAAVLPPCFGEIRLAGASTGSGNITVEVRELDNIRDGLQKLVQANGAVTRNYSEYTNQRRKGSLNAGYELKKASVTGFMDGLAKLGKMTCRNYSDQSGSGRDLEMRQRKLESYRRHLQKVLAVPGGDSEIVALLVQQIQSLESEFDSNWRGHPAGAELALINVQIIERGYNNNSNLPFTPATLIIIAAALICLIGITLGVILSRLFAMKRQRIEPGT